MNTIVLHGKVQDKARVVLVDTNTGQTPMVIFSVIDRGLPFKDNGKPVVLEVHFMKEPASLIYKYLVENKDVVISGYLAKRNYTDKNGKDYSKFYISAENVVLVPLDI